MSEDFLEISDTKKIFFQGCTKPTPKGLGMLLIPTEIDRGGRYGTQIQDSLGLVSPWQKNAIQFGTVFSKEEGWKIVLQKGFISKLFQKNFF